MLLMQTLQQGFQQLLLLLLGVLASRVLVVLLLLFFVDFLGLRERDTTLQRLAISDVAYEISQKNSEETSGPRRELPTYLLRSEIE